MYDPAGRLFETSGGGVVTRFLYDGDALVAEYGANGALLRRYVHGPGVDEPLVWYEGAGLGDRRGLLANHQGSIVGVTNASGGVLYRNTYEEYGARGGADAGRFSFTGQIAIPELGLLHYKARAYNTAIGRFMQTDPVGYDDQMNLYAYVGNDPVNQTDPTGECPWCIGALVGAGLDYGIQVTANLVSGQDLASAATNVDLVSIGTSAALGAVGGFAGGKALSSAAQGVKSIATKGKIGEAVARAGISLRGEKVVATGERAAKSFEGLKGAAARARPDFVVKDSKGALKAVEAKFGDSKLSSGQKALQSAIGPENFREARVGYDTIEKAGAAAAGAATGAATNCATGAPGPCNL